jgi:hypothetical protein
MFEFHMLVVVVIMFYILELIVTIVPNYPTLFTHLRSCRNYGKECALDWILKLVDFER